MASNTDSSSGSASAHETRPTGPVLVNSYTRAPIQKGRPNQNQPGLISFMRNVFTTPVSALSPGTASTTCARKSTALPPIKAFSFKGLLAADSPTPYKLVGPKNRDTALQPAGCDVNSDLTRIAEICALSKYSLSNQHELHKGPNCDKCQLPANIQSSQHAHILQVRSLHSAHDNAWGGGSARGRKRRAMAVTSTLKPILSRGSSPDQQPTANHAVGEPVKYLIQKQVSSKSPRVASQAGNSECKVPSTPPHDGSSKEILSLRSATCAPAASQNFYVKPSCSQDFPLHSGHQYTHTGSAEDQEMRYGAHNCACPQGLDLVKEKLRALLNKPQERQTLLVSL